MRIMLFAAVGAVALASAVPAAKPLTKARALAVMDERHKGMEAIGKANKNLRRSLQSDSPDITIIRQSATQISQLARTSSGWFPAGTGPELGKTGAKPEIWQNPQDFAAKVAAFQKTAQAFHATAASGNDFGAMKARYAELGKACAACHDNYRSELQH